MCSGLRTNVRNMFCSSVSILSQYGGHYGPMSIFLGAILANVEFFRRNIEKSSRDYQNILLGVLMHVIDSEILPEHIEFFLGSVFSWPIFISRAPDIPIQGERLKSGSG